MFQVFLDLHKAFDTVSRDRLLILLEDYGVGDITRDLLELYWNQQQTTLKQRNFFGESFRPTRGVTQGDVLSPTLFNICIDHVCKSLEHKISLHNDTNLTSLVIFYSDDVFLGGSNPYHVQELTDEAAELFQGI